MRVERGVLIEASPQVLWDTVVTHWQAFPGMERIDGPFAEDIRSGSQFDGTFNIFGQDVYGEGTVNKFNPASLAVLKVVNIKPEEPLPIPTPKEISIQLGLKEGKRSGQTQLDISVGIQVAWPYRLPFEATSFATSILVGKIIDKCTKQVKKGVEEGMQYVGAVDLDDLRQAA